MGMRHGDPDGRGTPNPRIPAPRKTDHPRLLGETALNRITGVEVVDVRFPTSLTADGSDAMNKDGDYSAAYVILSTDDPALSGYGFTFTLGRGNDICAM